MTASTNRAQYTDRPCEGPGCDRVLRSKGLSVEDAPGTFPAASRGMCRRCITRTRPARVRTAPVKVDVYAGRICGGTCGNRLRARGVLVADQPGTVEHAAGGVCHGCRRRAKQLAFDDAARIHRADVEAWLEARRRRGIPAEGIGWGVAA